MDKKREKGKLHETAHLSALASLGLASLIKEETQKALQNLIDKGKEAEKTFSKAKKKPSESKKSVKELLDEARKKTMENLNIATKTDVERIEKKISSL